MMIIDPPGGWKYGFPKPIPDEVIDEGKTIEWLVENGYPKSEIDSYGDHFYCRYWSASLEKDKIEKIK